MLDAEREDVFNVFFNADQSEKDDHDNDRWGAGAVMDNAIYAAFRVLFACPARSARLAPAPPECVLNLK